MSSSADNFSGSTTVLGQSLNPAGGAPGSTNRDLMTNPARFAGFSQFLGVAFAAVALFGFCWMNFTGTGHWVVVFAVVCAAILALARWKGGAVLARLFGLGRVLPTISPGIWLSGAIVLGLAIRLWAIRAFPAIPMQNWNLDMVRYWDLTHKLLNGAGYSAPEGRAFWPPGLPLMLAVLLPLFGSATAVVYSLGTFVLAETVTFVLGRMLGGWQAGCLAAFLLAVWPNFVFAAPLLNKESLLIALWPVVAYLYLKAHDVLSHKKAGLFSVLAGVSAGYMALTQPAMLLLPLCLALFSTLTSGWRSRRTFVCVLAAACGSVLVVTPWVVRDFFVFHRLVPITTGGGSMYVVTRPELDGQFNGAATKEWMALSADEAVRDEQGYSLGIQAIRDHPLHFFSTVVRKSFYLFGQDLKNIYWNFEHRDHEADTPRKYALIYSISNGFYLIIILLISMWVMGKEYVQTAAPGLILLWLFTLYPIFAHSLFEAAERHHYGVLPFMAIFAAMGLVLARRDANADFEEFAGGAEIISTG